jgi:glycerol kinase
MSATFTWQISQLEHAAADGYVFTAHYVVNWVKDKLTAEKVAEVEAALQAQLEEMGAPSKLSGLPW